MLWNFILFKKEDYKDILVWVMFVLKPSGCPAAFVYAGEVNVNVNVEVEIGGALPFWCNDKN